MRTAHLSPSTGSELFATAPDRPPASRNTNQRFSMKSTRIVHRLAGSLLALGCLTLASAMPASAGVAAAPTTVELAATADAGTIEGAPTFTGPNAYLVLSQRGNGDYDNNFIQFDLAAIPADATIDSASLHLNVSAGGGSVDVAAGRVDAAWAEATVNWSNQPPATWNGPVTTITAPGDAQWSSTALVQDWHSGAVPNNGVVLRGSNNSGGGKFANSSEDGIDPNEPPVAPKLVVTYHLPDISHDLGDAPDSSNHAGVNMAAYAGVQANFPTVFDPATGQPRGPLHLDPRAFHLGQQVSREVEADVGPDEDAPNNIEPAANVADLDNFDDGAIPQAWNLNPCARAFTPVQVNITQVAVDRFTQLGTQGYLNIFVDGNRDGDWADGFNCVDANGQQQASVEHIVIDFPVNAAALGAGTHVLQPLSGYVVWPAQLANLPSWARVTLSEQPSNKTLQFANIQYGDGRGYQTPFAVGETEDYRID